MSSIAKFTKGARVIDLTIGRYSLDLTFVPPGFAQSLNIALGTSANKTGVGKLIGKRPQPISFAMTVRILGSSEAECNRGAVDLATFLELAGDEAEPLYMHLRPNANVNFEPLWGTWGADRLFEVLGCDTFSLWDLYYLTVLKGQALYVTFSITIDVPGESKRQISASAMGGVFEDILGMADGYSRGVNIPLATTNKFTNPIFGHATYSNGWTTGSSLVTSLNTDKEFIVFGNASVKIIRVASVDWGFTQSINVGNTNTHCLSFYVKKPDKSAVTSADCQVYYNAVAQTTAFLAVGNGWYRAYATFAGVNAAVTAGIILNAVGVVLYVDGFHLEEAFYVTPAGHGDMLGWTWSGTAHASTSTRTAGRIRLPVNSTTFDIGQGTICMIWEAPYANTAPSGSKYFFSNSATGLRCGYNGVDDKIYLQDNTNNAISAAQTFAIGDKIVYHFIWQQGSMKAYKNGVEIATVAAYTPPAAGSYLYIGSDDSGAGQLEGTILGFDIYGRAMTAGEVLADYNNISPLVTDNQRISPVLYSWTNDGDGAVDNCDDATRDNHLVVCGVPGNTEAIAEYQITADFTKAFWLGNHKAEYRRFLKNTARLYVEANGTTDAGGTTDASGGEHKAITATAPRGGQELVVQDPFILEGDFNFFVRARLDSSTVTSAVGYYITTSNGTYFTTDTNCALTTTYNLYYLGVLHFAPPIHAVNDVAYALTFGVNFGSLGARTAWLDFAQVMPDPMMKISAQLADIPGGGGAATAPTAIFLKEWEAYFDTGNYTPVLNGKVVNLYPDVANTLLVLSADDGGAHVVGDMPVFNSIYVTPRWTIA